MTDLPTPAEVLAAAVARLNVAYRALGDARDELRSDTSGTWTKEQAAQKRAMFDAIRTCKHAINEARS